MFSEEIINWIWLGEILANHIQFAKFAKISPARILRYTIYLCYFFCIHSVYVNLYIAIYIIYTALFLIIPKLFLIIPE